MKVINNINKMNKIKLALKSRTVWTLVVLFLVNGVAGIHDAIPVGWVAPLDSLLGLLVVYFKVSPSQQYK